MRGRAGAWCERAHAELGRYRNPGSFGLTRAPDVNAPECVLERASGANDMAWLSAQDGVGHGLIQTGDVGRVTDGNGEPNGPHGTISETVPAPWNAACEVLSVFCEWLRRARLRDWESASKRSVFGTKRPRGRLKWRRLCEFGKHVSLCEHVRRGRCVVGRKCCSRDVSRQRRRPVCE